MEPVELSLPVAFRIELLLQGDEDGAQLVRGDRLQQKIAHLELHRFLGVLELIVTGEEDRFRPGMFLGNCAGELETIHKGHADVGQHHIRLQVVDCL